MRVEIAIVGAGPAGAAAGFALGSALGARCLCIEAGARAKAGEALGPSIHPLLAKLGLRDLVDAGGRKSPGLRAAWGGELIEESWITSPFNAGWIIDRKTFEAALRERARDAGAVCMQDRVLGVVRRGERFCLLCASGNEVEARCVLDATGRIGAIARRLGAKRRMHDRLVALHRAIPLAVDDARLLVETDAEGWWYSAATNTHLIVSYQTRHARLRFPPTPPRHTAMRIAGSPRAPLQRFAAGSSFLEPMYGDGWLAIGDAGAAHDPISGHGIAAAIASGFDGAEAALAWLAGDRDAFVEHAQKRQAAFASYLEGHALRYARAGLFPIS